MPTSSTLATIQRDPPAISQDPDALLTPAQVGALTQLEEQTLANMRWRKAGPSYVKLGEGRSAPVRYRRRDVIAWLDSQTVRTA